MRQLALLFAFLATLAAAGCAAKAPSAYDYAAEAPPPPPAPPGMADYGSTVATSAGASRSYSAPAKAAPRPTSTPAAQPGDTSSSPPDDGSKSPDQAQEAPAARMIHYNGYASLQATKTEETVDAVGKLAVSLGGFVEQLAPSRVTVRVPVERFDEAFKAILAMGEVLDKSVTAEDVTDAFTAIDLRLTTARTTRDRLIALLAQAKDENEKLQILAQIRRLSEEIDVMEGQIRTLSALASFSRITVVVQARPAFAAAAPGQDPVGFDWIHALSPFRRDVSERGELSPMDVPTGFVGLDVKKRFIAESADGAVIWTTELENNPAGSADFWIDAVSQRLAPEFQSVDRLKAGSYQILRFVSQTDDPYRYLVGVRVEGDDLYLVEVYYPSATQEDRYKDAVLAVIGGGKS